MLKKIIIGLYLSVAVFLMSFSNITEKPFVKNSMQEQMTEMSWQMLGRIAGSLEVMPNYKNIIKESLHGKKIKISGLYHSYR